MSKQGRMEDSGAPGQGCGCGGGGGGACVAPQRTCSGDSQVCTVEIRGVEGAAGEDGGSSCCRSAMTRLVALLGTVVVVTLAHEGYMAYTQKQVLQVAKYPVFPHLLYFLAPSAVPLLLSLTVLLTKAVRRCCGMRSKTREHIKHLFIIAFVFGLMHTLQVSLYLFVDTMIFMDQVPHNITCTCEPTAQPDVQSCSCYVPKQGSSLVLSKSLQPRLSDPISPDVSSDSWWLPTPDPAETESEVSSFLLTYMNGTMPQQSQHETLVSNLKMMILLLQCSIIVALLRFPLWVMFNNVQIDLDLRKRLPKRMPRHCSVVMCDPPPSLDRGREALEEREDEEEEEEEEKEESAPPRSVRVTIVSNISVMSSATTQTSGSSKRYSLAFTDAVTKVMRNLRLEKNREHRHWLLRSESINHKWRSYMYAIELCYYCFVEMVDAFSLLDNLSDNADYFVSNRALTYSTLFFISLSLLVGTAANFMASHPFRSRKINRVGKSLVVVSNNVPLFVLRCYMFYLFGRLGERGIGSVFLLFAIKELVILILAVIEIIIYCKTPKGAE